MKYAESRFAERFPELLLLEAEDSRKAAMKHAQRGSLLSWRVWLLWLMVYAVSFVSASYAERKIWLPSWLNAGGIAGGIAGGALGLIVIRFRRTYIAQRLREYLNTNGVPVCMKCGYSLRGLDTMRCPECGKLLDAAAPPPDDPPMQRTEYIFPSGDRDVS